MKPYFNPTLRFVRFTAWAIKHYPQFTVDYPTNVKARWQFRRAVRANPKLMF